MVILPTRVDCASNTVQRTRLINTTQVEYRSIRLCTLELNPIKKKTNPTKMIETHENQPLKLRWKKIEFHVKRSHGRAQF